MKSVVTLAVTSFCGAIALASTPANAATTAVRNYDCSKPGNATKAVCKAVASSAAAKPKPAVVVAAKPPAAPRTMTYDCAKPGNRTKAACKGMVGMTAVPAVAAPAPRPAPNVVVAPRAKSVMAPRVATSAPSPSGRTVAWTEKNGKVVHYDCSKAGNETKQACKQR